MIEREKVIKGLECHISTYCVECPYRKGWATCNAAETLFADALALLKEQEEQIKRLECDLTVAMENVVKAFDEAKELVWTDDDEYTVGYNNGLEAGKNIVLDLLKEQEKKRTTLHKKHVITWNRNDKFNMGKLYETVCETLLDEGELFIARTDNHEKDDFVFYVAEGRRSGNENQ